MGKLCTFPKEESGSVLVEMAIAITLLLTLTLGFIDFGYAFYQWNAATKSVQVGARLASVSFPIAPAIKVAGPTVDPGAPIPVGNYNYLCDGKTSLCGIGTWDAANFSRIFRGDTAFANDDSCPALAANQRPGMCHFFPGLTRANIVVRYSATGLGYQTRPGGAVPTITVSLQDINFQFFFLGGLLGFNTIAMPSMLSTVTGEDLSTAAPA